MKLMQRCREYVMEVDGVTESVDDYHSQHHPRIVGTVQSIDNKRGQFIGNQETRWTYRNSNLISGLFPG